MCHVPCGGKHQLLEYPLSNRSGRNFMKGSWALVTGSSSGFGKALAELLAERGINLILTARREDRLRKLREELLARHAQRSVQIELLAFDVRDWKQCERALQKQENK